MKIKVILTTLSAIVALVMMTMSAFAQNNAFSAPQNLGATLNSASNDIAPTISPSGLSLYFTSNRTAGSQGGNDIWVSRRTTLGSAWEAPQNLGVTVNSSANDNIGSLYTRRANDVFTKHSYGQFGARHLHFHTPERE